MTVFELTHCGHIYTTEMNKNTADAKAAVEHLHVNFFRECMNSKTLTRHVRKTLQHIRVPTAVGLHSVPTNKGDRWFAYRLSIQERKLTWYGEAEPDTISYGAANDISRILFHLNQSFWTIEFITQPDTHDRF